MQGNTQDLTKQYQVGMDLLFKAHEEQMSKARASYEKAVSDARAQYEALIHPPKAEPAEDPPLAVWSKTPSGEDVLILNREAAVMQMALLDQLMKLLEEFTKLAPKQK